MSYNVLVCDDQNISRQLFEMIISSSEEFSLVKSLDSARVADVYCAGGRVDLILMDVVMDADYSGLDAAEYIKKKYPAVKILMVTSMPEAAFMERARAAGVDSFWYKEVQDAPLLDVMSRTMAGEHIYPDRPPTVSLGLAKSTEFTPRELDVLRALVSGLSDKEIADKLCISFNTVRAHMSSLMAKTGFDSRTELALRAAQSGIVVPNTK